MTEPKWLADIADRAERMPNAEQLRELIAHIREMYAILDDSVGCPRDGGTVPCGVRLRAGCLRDRDAPPPRRSGTLQVRLKYLGRSKPILGDES